MGTTVDDIKKVYSIPKNNFCDLSKKSNAYNDIKSSMDLLLNNKKWIALFLLMVSVIDSFLGDTSDRTNKDQFTDYMDKYFKQYFDDEILTAEKFYDNFRNPLAHNFSIGKEYVIVNNHEINGEYVAKIKCEGKKYTALNIDKFVSDFKNHLNEYSK